MASIIFAAFAFAGAGFAFKKFSSDDIGGEMARHNAATEQLAAARDKWNKEEIAHRNKLQILKQELSDANADINDTNKALAEFNTTLRREPQLGDFYSNHYESPLSPVDALFGLSVGWIGYKTYRYLSDGE